mmetsp:Transcript_15133/g.51056  ORF Transcript_15133/g.51056 Transcript_15133/m.51056 type:complete len:378 (+) Transcript_15133:100-1233(+)
MSQNFSLQAALVSSSVGLVSNLIKSYTGFGGGIVFVSVLKVLNSFGALGEETGDDKLGGLAGNIALVTVMDSVTSLPLVIYDRHNIFWPVVFAISSCMAVTVPIGTSILQITVRSGHEALSHMLKRVFGGIVIAFVIMQMMVIRWREKKQKEVELQSTNRPAAVRMEEAETLEERGSANLIAVEAEEKSQEESSRADSSFPTSEVNGGRNKSKLGSGGEGEWSEHAPVKAKNEQFCSSFPGHCSPWDTFTLSISAVAGGIAGFLGGLFGAGGPPILVLFAYIATRHDLGITQQNIRSTGQTTYFLSIIWRLVVLAVQDLLFISRWWPYYLCVMASGSVGALAGSWLYHKLPTDTKQYQKLLQGMLVLCGLFFLFGPN